MKRTLAALLLVSGLGGCMSPDSGKKLTRSTDERYRNDDRDERTRDERRGEIRHVVDRRDELPRTKNAQEIQPVQAMERQPLASAVQPAGVARVNGGTPRSGPRAAYEVQPGTMHDPAFRQVQALGPIGGPGCPPGGYPGGPGGFTGMPGGPGGFGEDAYGPRQGLISTALGQGGILPAPGQGPAGVVAGIGMIGPGQANGAMFANQRTSIRFVAPVGMKIAFQDPARGFADAGREAPVRYNFPQGAIYRLRLNGIANRPGKTFYPTLEVFPTTLKTVTFLAHATVPIGFTDEDFEQVNAGNLVVKVIYLPDPAFQDLAAAEEIVSTRLEPGIDPITEANRRGTILAVIRVGNIDLEDPSTPAMDAPPGSGYGPPPGMGNPIPAPRTLPPGASNHMAPSSNMNIALPQPIPGGNSPQPISSNPGSMSRVPSGLPALRLPTPASN